MCFIEIQGIIPIYLFYCFYFHCISVNCHGGSPLATVHEPESCLIRAGRGENDGVVGCWLFYSIVSCHLMCEWSPSDHLAFCSRRFASPWSVCGRSWLRVDNSRKQMLWIERVYIVRVVPPIRKCPQQSSQGGQFQFYSILVYSQTIAKSQNRQFHSQMAYLFIIVMALCNCGGRHHRRYCCFQTPHYQHSLSCHKAMKRNNFYGKGMRLWTRIYNRPSVIQQHSGTRLLSVEIDVSAMRPLKAAMVPGQLAVFCGFSNCLDSRLNGRSNYLQDRLVNCCL